MTFPGNIGPQSFSGGNVAFALTNAMGTTAQLVKTGGGRLCRIHNPQAGSATITVYDAGSADATTLAASTIIWAGTVPTTLLPVDVQIPVQFGLVVKATSAVADTILITYV